MFQILKQTNFDFMRYGRPLLIVSGILCLASVGILAVQGLNLGIEFAGGTELQLKFQERPDLGEVRQTLSSSGVGNSVVTTIGAPEQHEIYIKIAGKEDEDAGDLTGIVVEALKGGSGSGVDLNVVDGDTMTALISGIDGVTAEQAGALSASILERRKSDAIISSVSSLADVDGMTPEILASLEQQAYAGPLVLRSQSYIGPAIGRELMQNALGAILGSLIGMLVYIWIRFQLRWGFAAVVALTHDTLISLGLFSLFNKEMSLPVVAAFLTLVGYSVNDTVVVFDRIRENLRLRPSDDLWKTVNLSINQTLSRTVITSGLTFIVVFGLLMFGGAALNPFAFVLTVGVVVGTYSSIFIASPLLVLWQKLRGGDLAAEEAAADAEPAEAPKRARKVRSGAAK